MSCDTPLWPSWRPLFREGSSLRNRQTLCVLYDVIGGGLEPKLDHPPPTKPWQGDLKPTHQGKSSKKGCCARVIRRGGLWQKLEVCLVATKNAFLQQKKILANAILLLQKAIHKSSKKTPIRLEMLQFHYARWKAKFSPRLLDGATHQWETVKYKKSRKKITVHLTHLLTTFHIFRSGWLPSLDIF